MKIPSIKVSAVKSTSGLSSKSPITSFKMPKAPSSFKITQPKIPKGNAPTSFNFSKFTKTPKTPKAAKMSIVKAAVKKVKNVGF